MSLEAIRIAIATAVEGARSSFTAHPLVVEYDNMIIVDTKTQTNPFLIVQTKLMDGEQADISNSPIHRIYGQIHLAAAVPEGSGRAKANALLDHFYPKLQRTQFGVVRTKMAVPVKDTTHDGWVYYPVLIPFWSDLFN